MGPLVRKLDHWWHMLEVAIGSLALSFASFACQSPWGEHFALPNVPFDYCLLSCRLQSSRTSCLWLETSQIMRQNKDFLSNYLSDLVVVVRRLTQLATVHLQEELKTRGRSCPLLDWVAPEPRLPSSWELPTWQYSIKQGQVWAQTWTLLGCAPQASSTGWC